MFRVVQGGGGLKLGSDITRCFAFKLSMSWILIKKCIIFI
jgi:hypothetical protein